ncbi:hypothetical protein SEUCBS139899_008576 [Sporothrix eucalyptigena]|uniref:Protein kinase domain-containing protein n=1 Tax=Sporothrix eucalyptigena TaxID=1812306 RepID=A0ABP0CKC9_9PEZI
MTEDYEDLEKYDVGGFHPIHIYETLGENGRYLVLNKLDYGGYGTTFVLKILWSSSRTSTKLSEDELFDIIGEPRINYVLTFPGVARTASVPDYLVQTFFIEGLASKYGMDQICFVDFGESFPTTNPPPHLGISAVYQPPNLLVRRFLEETSLEEMMDYFVNSEDSKSSYRSLMAMSETEHKLPVDLPSKILQYDPAKRLSVEKVLEHKMFKT